MTIKEALTVLIDLTRRTRESQRHYYATRSRDHLEKAKNLESELDQMLADYTQRLKAPQPQQSTIPYENGSTTQNEA